MAAEAGLCLAWSETPEDKFCRVMAHMYFFAKHYQNFRTLKMIVPALQQIIFLKFRICFIMKRGFFHSVKFEMFSFSHCKLGYAQREKQNRKKDYELFK